MKNDYKHLSLNKINLLFNMILNQKFMKTNKYFLAACGFLAGMVIGVSVIGLMSFRSAPESPAPEGEIVPISAETAQTLLKNFTSDSKLNTLGIKGFTIDKSQLEAMNSLAKENPDLAGFRVYMGVDASRKMVGIVVGVDNSGKDALKSSIFSTDAAKLSPCPPICDTTSPIIFDK
jgi:hypothetical protein